MAHICLLASNTKLLAVASEKLHKNTVMARGNRRRTTKRALSWSCLRNSQRVCSSATTDTGSSKISRTKVKGATVAIGFMLATALVKWKFAKRPSFEATKSSAPLSSKALAAQSPNLPARASASSMGKTHSAARTVPLTVQAHQKEAKVRSETGRSHEIQ